MRTTTRRWTYNANKYRILTTFSSLCVEEEEDDDEARTCSNLYSMDINIKLPFHHEGRHNGAFKKRKSSFSSFLFWKETKNSEIVHIIRLWTRRCIHVVNGFFLSRLLYIIAGKGESEWVVAKNEERFSIGSQNKVYMMWFTYRFLFPEKYIIITYLNFRLYHQPSICFPQDIYFIAVVHVFIIF